MEENCPAEISSEASFIEKKARTRISKSKVPNSKFDYKTKNIQQFDSSFGTKTAVEKVTYTECLKIGQ